MSDADVPKLLPDKAMGRRLGVDPKWLCEELRAGRLPGVLAGKTALFNPDVVERILLERATRAETGAQAHGAEPEEEAP